MDEEELERRRLMKDMPLAELRARSQVALRMIREVVALIDASATTEEERQANIEQMHALFDQMLELLPLVQLTPEERARLLRERDAQDPALMDKLFEDYDHNPEKYEELPEVAEQMAKARDAYERMKLHEELSIAMHGLKEHLNRRHDQLLKSIRRITGKARS